MNALTMQEVLSLFDKYVIANYTRSPVAFVRADGSYIWDVEGNRYVDLMPGWGTTTVGHCHPKVVTAVQRQAAKLLHVDNTFYTVPQGQLARWLSEKSFGGKCFFCNSGTEAIEAAIKLARLHKQSEGRYKIVTMRDSFHGRTMGAVSATGQDKYHKGYLPMLPGFVHVPLNDLDALRDTVDDETCAVMFEPVQGEGGVNPASNEFVTGVRKLCDENGMLMICDEVQTGVGRTGDWFGYQQYGVEPDIMALAKAIGGGVALGAMVAQPEVAASLVPGTHASTFGGNPLACAAGVAVFEAIEEEGLLARCRQTSDYIFGRLNDMAAKYSIIQDVRGRGVMIGVQLNRPGVPIYEFCLKNFVRVNCTHQTVIRMLPAMNIDREPLDQGLAVLEQAFELAQKGDI
jgi:acetylornithine/N-succinyldiaminopimelate aminotransferase